MRISTGLPITTDTGQDSSGNAKWKVSVVVFSVINPKISRMGFPILIKWVSPFALKGHHE